MPTTQYFSDPFDHWVIEGFLEEATAIAISDDFYDFDDERWLTRHDNELEHKKLSTHWDWYPKSIYSTFFYLNSAEFVSHLEQLTGIKGLKADYGLHAGGMHIHKSGSGRLNLHKDAEVHPKLGLKRKLNLIVYLNKDWEESWGGHLQLWNSGPDGSPSALVKSIAPMFNRAVLFDTSQDSWHGLPEILESPDGQHRKSIALFYYVDNQDSSSPQRLRALFAPRDDQKNDQGVLDKIVERATATTTYKPPR